MFNWFSQDAQQDLVYLENFIDKEPNLHTIIQFAKQCSLVEGYVAVEVQLIIWNKKYPNLKYMT